MTWSLTEAYQVRSLEHLLVTCACRDKTVARVCCFKVKSEMTASWTCKWKDRAWEMAWLSNTLVEQALRPDFHPQDLEANAKNQPHKVIL